jgi:high affinity Mn2+ porin
VGYTTGFAAELNQPDWTLRYGVFQIPREKNGLTADDEILKWPYDPSADGPSGDGSLLLDWGMVTELERRYSINGHPGVIRLEPWLNHGDFGNYQEALSVPGADITQTRAYRFKYGIGLNWEQEIVKNVGVFSRAGWSDGKTESWMFSDVDYTASLGLSLNGDSWRRPGDTFGLAGALNGLSKAHQEFFAAGGTGILAGDGNLNYGWEKVVETYYDFDVWKSVHFALDYQFIDDPAFNRDRGPVSVFGARLHWEF